jgi:hypothetical protein
MQIAHIHILSFYRCARAGLEKFARGGVIDREDRSRTDNDLIRCAGFIIDSELRINGNNTAHDFYYVDFPDFGESMRFLAEYLTRQVTFVRSLGGNIGRVSPVSYYLLLNDDVVDKEKLEQSMRIHLFSEGWRSVEFSFSPGFSFIIDR